MAVSAAPVVGEEGTVGALAPQTASQSHDLADDRPPATAGAAPLTSVPSLDRSLEPDTSTGNRHYDLLLDLQGQPDAQVRRVAPLSAAAASAAAAELAALRSRAAQGSQEPEDPLEAQAGHSAVDRQPRVKSGLSLQPFDGMGLQQIEQRATEHIPRRHWSGPFDRNVPQRTDSAGGYADESALRNVLRQTTQYLRENGAWLLALCGVIAVLALALKSYSRRI